MTEEEVPASAAARSADEEAATIARRTLLDAVVADALGARAFHCHILGHAEAATGMFGMVTALIVT